MKQDLNVQTQIPRQESHVKTLQKGQQRSSMGKKRVSSGGINSYGFLSFKRSGLKVEWIRKYENIKMLSLCTKYREARLKTPLGQKQNRNKLNFWAMGISWCPAQNLLSLSKSSGLLAFSPWPLCMSKNLFQNSEPMMIFALAGMWEIKTLHWSNGIHISLSQVSSWR